MSERYNWFKKKKLNDIDDSEDEDKKENDTKWIHYRKRKAVIKALEAQESEKVDLPPKAVLFVHNTPNGELASDIKKIIADLRPWTGYNVKVVERGGTKIQDLLCKSNP